MAKSWLSIPAESHFSLANIPFGIISYDENVPRVAIAIGEFALDLQIFAQNDGFALAPVKGELTRLFSEPDLNLFASMGRNLHRDVRHYLQEVLDENTEKPQVLKDNENLRRLALIPLQKVTMHLPMAIGDYTDFYAGRNHAYNVGVMFRGAENALQPNYNHLPVGYHGRASSIVVSGTPIRRPNGQVMLAEGKPPSWSTTRKLDIELEIGAFVCKKNKMGDQIPIAEAEEYLFGLVLLNDWSARDIQAWEYVPLGPFNGKNFATSISPWVVLMDALEPFRTRGIPNETDLLPYLRESKAENVYDITLEVDLTSKCSYQPRGDVTNDIAHLGTTKTITRTSSKHLMWSFPQMLAHHAVGGCPMNVGDLLGSGTISGTEKGQMGSMLEQCENGKTNIEIDGRDNNHERRKFLCDGDRIAIRGFAAGPSGIRVGFGECVGRIEPAATTCS
jgi:fumarylacetoacetase